MMRVHLLVSIVTLVLVVSAGSSRGQGDAGAAWELKMLGVNSPARLDEMAAFKKQRTVKLAIVGQGGVSEKRLASVLTGGNKVVYHDCADSGANTHDTQEARVTLSITNALGVTVELHLWQAGSDFADVADKFRQAGEVADVVCLYQSFWGSDTPVIHDAIRQSDGALFVSPYVEVGDRLTNNTPQGSACKPWTEDSIMHFVTVAPLSRKAGNGRIFTPKDRGPTDSEAINFIAPSYHASGPGGTCPSGAVAAACAVYLCAAMDDQPTPGEVVELMRDTSKVDRTVLTAADEFDDDDVNALETQVKAMRNPAEGKQRKLDAPGVLSLYDAFRRMADAKGDAQRGEMKSTSPQSGQMPASAASDSN